MSRAPGVARFMLQLVLKRHSVSLPNRQPPMSERQAHQRKRRSGPLPAAEGLPSYQSSIMNAGMLGVCAYAARPQRAASPGVYAASRSNAPAANDTSVDKLPRE